MEKELELEVVFHTVGGPLIERMEVPGGWIYILTTSDADTLADRPTAMVFVPFPTN